MNYVEMGIIGLLLVNLVLIFMTGSAITNQINENAIQLSEDLANLLTEQLPEAISSAAEQFGNIEQVNPLQQMAVEYMRNMMNNTVTATVTDVSRDESGKFESLTDRS